MMEKDSNIKGQIKSIYRLLLILFSLFVVVVFGLLFVIYNPDAFSKENSLLEEKYVTVPNDEDFDKIENGIHIRTGFVEGDGLMETVNNCTNCHSSQLVLQNRMSKERWISTIRWMQKTQNLWDLGKNEEIIVNYLTTNYPPLKKGRRAALNNVDWYKLKE